MTKFFNAILILIILVAGGRLAMQGIEYRPLWQERNQLIETLDGFRVRDRSKYLVQMVDTSDPMLFMWRVYIPRGFEPTYFGRCVDGGSTTYHSHFSSGYYLERVSVRFEFDVAQLYVDMQAIQGGCQLGVGDEELVAFCHQHWGDLEIEVLGQGGAIEVDVAGEVDLLRIAVPDELLTKVEAKFGKDMVRRFSKNLLFRYSFGERGVIERSRQKSYGGP